MTRDTEAIPANATYTYSLSSQIAPTEDLHKVSLRVTEANNTGSQIVANATNTTRAPIAPFFIAELYCFTGSTITNAGTTYPDQYDSVAPNNSFSFAVDAPAASCDRYLVGIAGDNF